MRRVLVPPHPGTLSALGLLLSDVVKDYSRTLMLPTRSVSAEKLGSIFSALEGQAAADMAAEGVDPASVTVRRSLDMRYRGQSYELTVPALPSPPAAASSHALEEGFHAEHAAIYGHSSPGQPTEIVQARLQAIGRMAKPALSRLPDPPDRPAPAPGDYRRVRLREWREIPIYRRCDLLPGHRLDGPALVLQEDTTTLVAPEWRGAVDGWGNLVMSYG